MEWTLLCQALALLGGVLFHLLAVVVHFPVLLVKAALGWHDDEPADSVQFYEGHVEHVRRLPVVNEFRYPVRVAVVNLDAPPSWWQLQAGSHMSADAARKFAGTDGKVLLLTNPISAGYEQNPISVYYCYDEDGDLSTCISEVTNTPWAERLTFVFNPADESVPKALHVSPLMDMQGSWRLRASEPGEKLMVYVGKEHPEMGKFFDAVLTATRCSGPAATSRCEHAGLANLLRYGFQPHRVAVWIYWQALVLLWKGVPFYSPPSKAYRYEKEAAAASHPLHSGGTHFVWREAKQWPWREEAGGPDEVVVTRAELEARGLRKAPGGGGCPWVLVNAGRAEQK